MNKVQEYREDRVEPTQEEIDYEIICQKMEYYRNREMEILYPDLLKWKK